MTSRGSIRRPDGSSTPSTSARARSPSRSATAPSGSWAMPARAVAALVAAAGFVAGCSGSPAPAFRVGMLSDCYGPFAGLHQLNLADAELPLIERGARLAGRSPSAGLHDVVVAGRRVQLMVGCVSGTEDVIPEARRLVEEDGAQAI